MAKTFIAPLRHQKPDLPANKEGLPVSVLISPCRCRGTADQCLRIPGRSGIVEYLCLVRSGLNHLSDITHAIRDFATTPMSWQSIANPISRASVRPKHNIPQTVARPRDHQRRPTCQSHRDHHLLCIPPESWMRILFSCRWHRATGISFEHLALLLRLASFGSFFGA